MYGEWWIERLERQAVEAKLEAFIAGLEPDERVKLESILRHRYTELDRRENMLRELSQAEYQRQLAVPSQINPLNTAGFSAHGNIFGWPF